MGIFNIKELEKKILDLLPHYFDIQLGSTCSFFPLSLSLVSFALFCKLLQEIFKSKAS